MLIKRFKRLQYFTFVLQIPKMNYTTLSNTDIKVSKICLGTMTFGEQNSESDAHSQLDYATDKGVNFIDTAEMYPIAAREATLGKTERYIGTWLIKSDQILWGQGGKIKTKEEISNYKHTENDDEKELKEMIIAFGNENHQVDFNWQQQYGNGFSVIDNKSLNSKTTISNDETIVK